MEALNFGPYILVESLPYLYELTDEAEPSKVRVLKAASHGPPEDPPVILHPKLQVNPPLLASGDTGPAQ